VPAAYLSPLGFVAPPENAPALYRVSVSNLGNRRWPSYAPCVEGTPENRGRRDRTFRERTSPSA